MIKNQLVGRRSLLKNIHCLLNQVAEQSCLKVISVTGSAGTGKSSLVHLLFEQIKNNRDDIIIADTECIAQTGASTPYKPFADIVQLLAGQTQGIAGLSDHWSKRVQDVSIKAVMNLGPDLLGTIIPGADLLRSSFSFIAKEMGWFDRLATLVDENQSSEIDTEKVCEQYTKLLNNIASHYPLVLCIDDAQWADSSSLHLLDHITHALKDASILILLVNRLSSPAETEHFGHTELTLSERAIATSCDLVIDLDSLERDERYEFTCDYIDAHPNEFAPDFKEALFAKTDGHPHFTVEIIHKLCEQGHIYNQDNGLWVTSDDLDWSKVPSHYDTLLKGKLEAIDPDLYDLLTWASVEGTVFNVPTLANLHGVSVIDCAKRLSRVLDKKFGFVVERELVRIGERWLTQYAFVSSRLRSRVYDDLSRCEKMLMHEQVAESLAELYADNEANGNALMAHHYEQAGHFTKASEIFLALGKQALRTHSYVEAIGLLEKSIAQIKYSRSGPETDKRLVEAYIPYCTALKSHKGWRSPDAMAAYQVAIEYCRSATSTPKALMPFLFGVWGFQLNALDFKSATNVANDIVDLSNKNNCRLGSVFGHLAIGNTLFWQGDLLGCHASMVKAEALFTEDLSQEAIDCFGVDPRSFVLMFAPVCDWLTGHYQRAVTTSGDLFKGAEGRANPFDLAFSLFSMVWQSWLQGDRDQTKVYCRKLTELTTAHKIEYYLEFSALFDVWVCADGSQSKDETDACLGAYPTLGPKGDCNLHYPFYILLKAEISMSVGRWTDALKDVRAAITWAKKHGCTTYLAEYWRLVGLIQAHYRHAPRRAMQCFSGAYQIALEQGATFFCTKARLSHAQVLVDAQHYTSAKTLLCELEAVDLPAIEQGIYSNLINTIKKANEEPL